MSRQGSRQRLLDSDSDTDSDTIGRADTIFLSLFTLFLLERGLKLGAVVHFFARRTPPPPSTWPSITLLQPITTGTSDLASTLHTRMQLHYAGDIQHLLICDTDDRVSQEICQRHLACFPDAQARLVLVPASAKKRPASKTGKLLTALPHATGEVLCFLDDDVALRPDTLQMLIPTLLQPGVGATFGTACYTNWETPWSSLMSLFVNSNALLSYLPLSYLTEPFTITGHCFALQHAVFTRIGGLSDLAERVDDDHELARRVRTIGLRNVQTPLLYDVNNALGSLSAYLVQIKRWFVLPRQSMLPEMSTKEQWITLLASFGNLLPGLLLFCGLLTRRRSALRGAGASVVLAILIQLFCERRYLHRYTPLRRWPLLPVVILFTPFQVLLALFTDNTIEWRGQRWRIERGGTMLPLPPRQRRTRH